jgi:choline dehydrogenase
VLPFFIAMEDYDRGASKFHGVGGPLHVNTTWEPSPIAQAFRKAAEECGIPFNEDCNDGEPDGFSYVQMTTLDGRRQNSAIAYLRPVSDHPNLTVQLGAHATSLILEGGRCVGVRYEAGGEQRRARAGVEVIVSAGALESPRLLMLSGIGPAEHLRSHGIEVAVDLSGVGGNLHDHVLSPVVFSAQREIGPPPADCWAAESHLFWRSLPGLVAPDIQPIHFSAPLYEDWMSGPANGFSLLGGLVRPVSRGSIRLTSADPHAELAIDPRTLSCSADLDAVEAAVNLCREMGAAAALAEWGAAELYPGPEVSTSAELRDYIRRTAITYHHQVGTAKMGTDEEAVVDPQLRVRGIESLRVADASVMPTVTSGNTNAASLMIGERVAAFIAADR